MHTPPTPVMDFKYIFYIIASRIIVLGVFISNILAWSVIIYHVYMADCSFQSRSMQVKAAPSR